MLPLGVVLLLTTMRSAAAWQAIDAAAPLPAVVAISHIRGENIPTFVKTQVAALAAGRQPVGRFPLQPGTSDSVRVADGLLSQVVVRWLDPLGPDTSAVAPRFGANNDYLAYFGDGWDADWHADVPGSAPQFNGSPDAGWLWVNHEYVSNTMPTRTTAPRGQHRTLAAFLHAHKILTNDISAQRWSQSALDTYIRHYKRQLGGSWLRVVRELVSEPGREPAVFSWHMDRSAAAVRFDATDATLTAITGHTLLARDHDDEGNPLPVGVVPGILADCSGGLTPWGTVITAEENHHRFYGDIEICWGPQQEFIPANGCAPGGSITLPSAPSRAADFGLSSHAAERHQPEAYGYLVEIDPRRRPDVFYTSKAHGGSGDGHRKLGSLGRARWENVSLVVDTDWKLPADQPVVLYAANDRPSGRVYKWVSSKPYRPGMTRAQIRALLDHGTLFVAHFADLDNRTGNTLPGGSPPTEQQPGYGRWIRLSVESADLAANAAGLGAPSASVAAALRNPNWNGMGSFDTDAAVRRSLFTAAAKIGVRELNRPEDVEWNPNDPSGTPRLYIAFTGHTQGTQLDQAGRIWSAGGGTRRNDASGSIFALQEDEPDHPAASENFRYMRVWSGSVSQAGNGDDPFAATNPDNLMLDRDGGVWFCTDGNFAGTNGRVGDGLYYLDLDFAHRPNRPGIVAPSYGRAFRIVGMPSDAEATGPAFNADMTTIFLSVQHPGEYVPSSWPKEPRVHELRKRTEPR